MIAKSKGTKGRGLISNDLKNALKRSNLKLWFKKLIYGHNKNTI